VRTSIACWLTAGRDGPVKRRTATDLLASAYGLCVPKISSTSCDQAIFVDQTTNMSLFSDTVLVEVDRFG
jgi:hypothetical protein